MRRLGFLTLFWVLAAALAAGGVRAQERMAEEAGLLQRWIESRLSDAGREVRIEGFRGALSGRAELDTLTIADAQGVWLRLSGAVLDWDRAALFSGRLDIRELAADKLELLRWPAQGPAPGLALPDLPTPAAGGFALPELPVEINFGRLSVARARLAAPVLGESVELALSGTASLAGGEGQAALEITRIDGRAGRFILSARYANASRALALSLTLEEPEGGIVARLLGLPGQPALALVVDGRGTLDDFAAALTLDVARARQLEGRLSVKAQGSSVGAAGPQHTLALELEGDLRPLLPADLHALAGARAALAARAVRSADGALVIETLELEAGQVALSGNGALDRDGWPVRLDLSATLGGRQGEEVSLPLPAPRIRVAEASLSLTLEAEGGEGRIGAWKGALRARGLGRGDVTLDNLLVAGEGQLLPGGGDAQAGFVNGRLALRLDGLGPAGAAHAVAFGPHVTGGVAFRYVEGGPLILSELLFSAEGVRVSGQAEIGDPFGPMGPVAELRLKFTAADLARFAGVAGRPLGGALELGLEGRLAPLGGAFDLVLEGQSRDLSLGLSGLDPLLVGEGRIAVAARRDLEGTWLDRAELVTTRGAVRARGEFRPDEGTARLEAETADAAVLAPGFSGGARLELDLAGKGATWQLRARGTGPGGARLAGEGTATIAGGAVRAFAGDATVTVEELGPWSSLAGRPLGGALSLEAGGQADLAGASWSLRLDGVARDLAVSIPFLDPLLRGRATLSAALGQEAGGALALEVLELRSPALAAKVAGVARADSSAGGEEFRLSAELRSMAELVPGLEGGLTAEGNARRRGADWNVDLDLRGAAGTAARVSGTIRPASRTAALTMTGTAPLALANRFIEPQLLSGPLAFELALDGPIALSSLSGSIGFSGASAALPTLKMFLDDLEGQAAISKGQAQIEVRGRGADGGNVAVAGNVSLAPPFNAALRVTLSTLPIRRAGLVETTANGELTLTGSLGGRTLLAGRVELGATEMRLPEGTAIAAAALPGLVHRNLPAAVRLTLARAGLLADSAGAASRSAGIVRLDLMVSAPSRLFVRGRGLEAEFGGALRLRGTFEAVVPTGRFELLRGRFDFLGRKLELTEASVTLRGSFEPYLAVRAVTLADGIEASVLIEGPASAPVVAVSSRPPLPQDEILARIAFGRDLSSITPLQALRLASAVSTLAGPGGAGVVERLRTLFGLDTIEIGSPEPGAAQLRVGRYLGENLYTDVEVDTSGRSSVNLQLSVTPSLTLRGRLDSGGDTGVGVFYEKDY